MSEIIKVSTVNATVEENKGGQGYVSRKQCSSREQGG